MPRAMGASRHAGFDVIAWPADCLSLGVPSEWVKPNEALSEGLRRVDSGAKEWIGLLAYRLTNRTDELFPGSK